MKRCRFGSREQAPAVAVGGGHRRRRHGRAWGLGVALLWGTARLFAQATATSTINVSCEVPPTISLTANGGGGNDQSVNANLGVLADDGGGKSMSVVMGVKCNDPRGYTITLQAQDANGNAEDGNLGVLATGSTLLLTGLDPTATAEDRILCTVTYDSSEVAFVQGGTTLAHSTSPTSGIEPHTLGIGIPYSVNHANFGASPGLYGGKLVFTIIRN